MQNKPMDPLLSARMKLSLIRAKKISVNDNVSFCLKIAEEAQKNIKPFTFINKALAIKKSKESNLDLSGRLAGLTFSAKDHFLVKDLPASEASKQTLIQSAKTNDRYVSLFENEGAICIGKGNLPEYRKSTFTRNEIFGTTLNPFNSQYTSGGSSGGDAVAVACGAADFGLAGDGGGSLRIPANYCGIFSILATTGLLEGTDDPFVLTSFLRNMGSVGPLARTLNDLELVFEVMCQKASSYPNREIPRDSKTNNFLILKEVAGIRCDKEIEENLDFTAKSLENLGLKGIEKKIDLFDHAIPVFYLLAGQAGLVQEDVVRKRIGSPRDLTLEGKEIQGLRDQIKKLMPAMTVESLLDTIYIWDSLKRESAKIFENFDFILAPVSATIPLLSGAISVNLNGVDRSTHELAHFSRIANILGLPALSFPTIMSTAGLPLGLQVMTRRFYDSFLFEIVKKLGFTKQLRPKP
ncbi:MAG: amidase [bacterium]|nr:amidase [bacterium]